MSASIYYRVVRVGETHVDVAAPSMFVESMNRAFGSYPWRLTGGSLPILQGMAAASCDGAKRNPYQALIDAIAIEDGTSQDIEVWPEY